MSIHSATRMQSTSICRADGQVVGKVRGDTFCKNVQASKHFLRKPEAIAFDVQSLMDARQAGAQFVCVTDTESGKVYRAPVHTVLHDGFTLDRGFGVQVALPLAKWNTGGDDIGAQLTFAF